MTQLAPLCLFLVLSVSVSVGLALEYTPVYTWSNTEALGDGTAAQVRYQTISTFDAVNELLSSDKAAGQLFDTSKGTHDTLIAVFIDQKVSPSTLEAQNLVSGAKSSVVLQNAQMASSNKVLTGQLQAYLKTANAAHLIMGCGEGSVGTEELNLATPELHVVLLCRSDSGIKDFQDLQKALENSNRQYVAMYVPSPQQQVDASAEPIAATRRRSLLAAGSFGPYTVCDTVCQTQVRWLEGILAGLLLAMASMSGLCCLYFLDTPTKFETAKDHTQ